MADLFRSKGLKCLLTALLALSLALAFCALPGLAVRAEAGSAAGAQWRDIKDVIAGEGFTVALREDGKVLYAGDDFSGVGQRIRSWDGIKRIELQGWQSYLVGYREDGPLRLEALLDREQYGYSDLWSEKDLASWSGVEQLYLDYGVCLGLTRAGRVLAISRDPEDIALIARLLAGKKKPCGIYFISEDIFTLASYYLKDLHETQFLPEGWQVLPDDEEEMQYLTGGDHVE